MRLEPESVTSQNPSTRRRYAVAGLGHRSHMYVDAILGDHADVAELAAFCEPNRGRAAVYTDLAAERGRPGVPTYAPADLEQMITAEHVDTLIVTTPDATHADLVARALRAGADVVVEKPLTTTAQGCRTITDAVAETSRSVVMTFNYRYAPRNSELRRVIASGEIGEVTSVHFEWVLDSVHGADYFRRWHRLKDVSGGLLVHKSSHHFDLVSWWIADAPTRVYARGGLKVYGDTSPVAREMAERDAAAGLPPRPARGTGSADGTRGWEGRAGDRWALDLRADERLKALYLDAEHHDGYVRDQDVFSAGITIEDNLALLVDYERGATLTYSLNAHGPWEGYRVSVNGTKGRAELEVVERGSVELDERGRSILDPSANPGAWEGDDVRPFGDRLVVQKHWGRAREVPIPAGIGGHGGGDAILLQDVFRAPVEGARHDPLGRAAGYLDGVRAVAVGISGNASLASGQPVDVADLGLGVSISVPWPPERPAGAGSAEPVVAPHDAHPTPTSDPAGATA